VNYILHSFQFASRTAGSCYRMPISQNCTSYFFSNPIRIEARTVVGHKPAESTGDIFQSLSPGVGLVCYNGFHQLKYFCKDYEVRYLCPVTGEFTCIRKIVVAPETEFKGVRGDMSLQLLDRGDIISFVPFQYFVIKIMQLCKFHGCITVGKVSPA